MQEEALNTPTDLTYRAADGHVGRLRLPGGRLASEAWAGITELAEFGDGRIHLTSRGNLRIRGISDPAAFTATARDAGFRAGAALIASPLSPLQEIIAGVDEIATEVAHPGLLLGVDDGTGDILSQAPDLGLELDQGRENARLIRRGEVVGAELPLAHALLALREACVDLAPGQTPAAATGTVTPPIGWLGEEDGRVTLAAGLQFGMLEARVAQMIGVIGADITVTPWRSLLIHGLSESTADQVLRVLAPLGLIFNAESPWLRVSACISAPGCRHALSEVRGDAARAIAAGAAERLHFVGCSRNCGRPKEPHTLYQATAEGEYEVIEG